MRIFSRTTNHEDMVIPGMRRWGYMSAHQVQYKW
jgi:hypothetical protein